MIQYIDKDPIVAELEKRLNLVEKRLEINKSYSKQGEIAWERDKALYDSYNRLLSLVNTLEVKEVDLEKEIDKEIETRWRGEYLFTSKFRESAKHFFELGLSVSNPITAADRGTAEEIIINLKRVESDYRIDLTKEITWVRNKVQKGE